ncbi:MAG: hypothetical protein R3C49_15925 [Planctomycetaceae bacterium]
MVIKSEIILPAATLLLTHELITGDPERNGEGITITEEDVEPDTLTSVEVRRGGDSQTVHVLWRPQSWHLNFCLLFVPETSVLFIGGGTFSATVNVSSMKIIHQHRIELFWSFQHMPRSILELGEIECILYRTSGELVGSVPVDPPYDVVEQKNDVEFLTSLFGIQRLTFPTS